jgi:hypothetical protein
MSKYRTFSACVWALVAAAAGAATNVVDVAALAACGTGTTNGWTVANVTSYAGTANFRLNSKTGRVVSPVFAEPVKAILVAVRSSSQSGRRLVFTPLADGVSVTEQQHACAHTASDERYEPQEIEFPRACDVRQFQISLESDGSTTAWGVSSMKVVTFDPPSAAAPADAAVVRVRDTSVTAGWTPDANAASNLVTVFAVRHVAESYETVRLYTFDEEDFSNDGGNPASAMPAIAGNYPDLSGSTLLYIPARSSGRIQISKQDERGILVHSAFDNYSDISLSLTLGKAADADDDTVRIGYELPAGTTNIVSEVAISTELRRAVLPLADVPGGCRVLVNARGRNRNNRVILDEMAFLRGYVPESTTTNVVSSVWSARPGVARITGLAPETDYLFSVAAMDAEGALSAPSEPVAFRTLPPGAGQGLRITLK